MNFKSSQISHYTARIWHQNPTRWQHTSKFTSSGIYSTVLSICHDYLLTVSPGYFNKNTNAAGDEGEVRKLCLYFFWTMNGSVQYSPKRRLWINKWLIKQVVRKCNENRWKQMSISYLSCHLFDLVNSFRIKQDLSASPFTVLVDYQANLIQVKLRTRPTVG